MRKNIKIEIKADFLDSQGIKIRSTPWKQANSLINTFLKLLQANMSQANITIKDTGGTDRTIGPNAQNLGVNAGNTITTFGIVIGTGDNAVAMTDNKLETQVTANVAHAITTIAAEAPDANSYRLVISRQFTNNTGALLSITEVGLYSYIGGTTYFGCLDRTLYSVSVASGSAVILTYRITISL